MIALDVVANARLGSVQPSANEARKFRFGVRAVRAIVVMLANAWLRNVRLRATGMWTNDTSPLLRFLFPTLLKITGNIRINGDAVEKSEVFVGLGGR